MNLKTKLLDHTMMNSLHIQSQLNWYQEQEKALEAATEEQWDF